MKFYGRVLSSLLNFSGDLGQCVIGLLLILNYFKQEVGSLKLELHKIMIHHHLQWQLLFKSKPLAKYHVKQLHDGFNLWKLYN